MGLISSRALSFGSRVLVEAQGFEGSRLRISVPSVQAFGFGFGFWLLPWDPLSDRGTTAISPNYTPGSASKTKSEVLSEVAGTHESRGVP